MDYQNIFKAGVLSVADMYAAFQGAFIELAQNFKSTTEPNPTFARQWWMDETTGLLKQRNSDNTAWIVIGKLNQPYLGLMSNYWSPNRSCNIGDICYPMAASYKRMECVVAGVTGTAEPTWGNIGTLVTDGGVTWIVDDIRDGVMPGDICNPSMIVMAGRLKLNGALISRTAYPRLFRFANDNGLITTEATWAATSWGLFGAGDGSTTFRLPDLRSEFIRGLDDSRGIDGGRAIGSTKADSYKAHTHPVEDGFGGQVAGWGGQSNYSPSKFNVGPSFAGPASTVVTTNAGGGTETCPRNVAYYYTMKY